MKTNKQDFLSGHTHNISSLVVSSSGRLVASGQINHMGFRAHLIVWNWEKRCEILRHELHKVRVQDLCFSSDEEHIISLGGKDCGMIIVWNINKKFVGSHHKQRFKLLNFLFSAWLFVVAWQQEKRLVKLQSLVDCIDEAESSLQAEIVSLTFFTHQSFS